MKILALTKYGEKAASSRQRLLQYREHFSRQGIEVVFSPLLTNDYLERTFSGRPAPILSTLRSYVDRAGQITRAKDVDLIWVQYESFPYMPGILESLLFIAGKPVVCDFDDAIFHQYDSHRALAVRALLGGKLRPLLKGASLCICGNSYIESYARLYTSRTSIIPTVLDTTIFSPRTSKRDPQKPVTVGWIGSPSTWTFVQPLAPLLETLADRLNLNFSIVGAGQNRLRHPRFQFLEWSEQTEVAAIRDMDIGIMPLPDQPWARGKCGYKLIQYMACGIPVIASPVGVNADIVESGVNGFLAQDSQDWEAAVDTLSRDPELRTAMGNRGRSKVEEEYSLHTYGPRLTEMLLDVVARRHQRPSE